MSYLEREYSPPSGPMLPFGAFGVAGAMAALLGLVGFLLPTTLIESVAFQLYLDTIIGSAVPPFGWLAKVVAGLFLACIGWVLGLVLARLFGVRNSGTSFSQLLAKFRGIGAQDDEDAPVLRHADRHPDAPARRPFSAATDIPARNAQTSEWDQHWAELPEDGDDDDGELLLTSDFSQHEDTASLDDDARVLRDQAPYFEESYDEPAFVAATHDQVAVAAEEPETHNAAPHIDAETALRVSGAVIVPKAEPIDLSAERLDVLLARLEAGLANQRLAPAAADMAPTAPHNPSLEGYVSATVEEQKLPHGAAEEAAETLFPQDPALAAALATLRRMNQHVG